MLDLVARGDILDALIEKRQKTNRYKWGENWELNLSEIKEAVESVPSAEPERTANVYKKQAPDRLYYFYCGACGEMIDCSFYEDYKSIKSYCGYCGAKLDWSWNE